MSDKPASPPAAAPAPAPAKPAPPKLNPAWVYAKPFLFGGLSGMIATTCIQPIDMIKVRIQLLGEGGGKIETKNPFKVTSQIIAKDGFFSLYRGLSAGLLRQATYTTARMGLFRTISNSMQTPDGKALPFWKKTVAGLAAGGLGSVFGTPADVALIRMQSDATLPVDKRRNYKGVVDALSQMLKQEGVQGLFKGNVPVVFRAMSLNVGMLAVNDQATEFLKTLTPNQMIVGNGSKLISGFCASFFSLPFDFMKTRMQKQTKQPDGTYKYKNLVSCFTTVAKEEGLGAFYRGFWTYYVRIAHMP
jgi:solute carrier family 25 oxoglutarate transporter 11